MSTTAKPCSICGNPLPGGVREEFCPVCSIRGALELEPEEPALPESIRYVGDYELLEPIARGGMGVVYRARQKSLGRDVAVKMILAGCFASSEARERFRLEASAAAKLQHPNIVAIHEIGEHEGQPYYSMDFVEGRTLAEVLRDGPLPARRAAGYLRAIAQAIHFAHTRGTLHRDLKPSNVLIDAFDEPRVTDFGLARQLGDASDLTQSGQVLGSPGYVSPEQARGERNAATTASDVYSLGAILYHALTGRPPFQGENPQAVLRQVENDEPVPPRRLNADVPQDLETIALKCLEKEPARRYRSAEDFADDLDRFLKGEPVRARPVGAVGRAWRWAKRRPALAALWAGLALALALGFAGISWQWRRAETHADRESRQRERAETLVTRLEWQRAEDSLQAGDVNTALAYLAHQARLHFTNAAAVERLLWILEQNSFPLPLAPALQHDEAINHAEFSRDGQFVVTASRDKTARVWDARSGQPVTPPLRHGDGVAVARFSPDGSRVVTGCADVQDTVTFVTFGGADAAARIWDARTGELLVTLAHGGSVPAAEFSSDGRLVLTCSHDQTARVWNAATGQPVTPPLAHSRPVLLARFSPDGSRVLTVAGDSAQLWDAFNGNPVGPPLKHVPNVLDAAFSPDGTRIVTAGFDQRIVVWDATSGKPALPPLSHPGQPACARFSPDGRKLLSISLDRTARLWDAATGQPIGQPFDHRSFVTAVGFSPDSNWMLMVPDESSLHIRETASGKLLAQPIRHTRAIKAAQFSPDGQRILTASADGTAQIWDIRPGRARELSLRHRGGVHRLAFSTDGSRVATASADGTARIWEVLTGAPVVSLRHGSGVSAVQFSRDGHALLTASGSEARLWDTPTGKLRFPPLKHGHRIPHAGFSPDERRILTAGWDGLALLWDATTGQAVGSPLQMPPKLQIAAFSPDGRWLGIASDSGTVQIWNAQTLQLAGAPMRHTNGVIWLAFSPDSKKVLTTSWDQTARVWDAGTGAPLTLPLKHSSWVINAMFSPDGRRIVTASRDNTAQLWDAATGQPFGEALRHQKEVRFAAFSPDGQRVVTTSYDRTARLWDARTGWPLSEPLAHGGNVRWAAFSPDGRRLATASADGVARIWDLPGTRLPAGIWLPDLAEALAGQRLNDAGSLVPVEAGLLWKLRTRWEQQAGDATKWARWFFADRSSRPGSPSATLTAEELAKQNPANLQSTPLSERIPRRDSMTSSNCIDLSEHYTAALTDDWHGRQWKGNNLAVLAPGERTLAGVTFDVRGIVQLSGVALRQSGVDFPEAVTGIGISRKVSRLHFLQATSWGLVVTNGTLIGRYVVHYADGSERTVPILNGIDAREWQMGNAPARNIERAVVAWQGRNARNIPVHLFKSTWENPRAELQVESIDFVSEMTQSAPFLIALTAE